MTPRPGSPLPTPLANVDAAWLRMDDPTNLMVVTGVMVLDTPVPRGRVRDVLETRLLKFPRFSQRVVEDHSLPVGTPSWEADPRFDLDRHLVDAALPAPADEAALQGFVSGLMSEPLDARHPLWQFHFIPDYQGGSALVGRIHHAIGDGLALIYVMLTMADGGFEPPPAGRDRHGAGENHGEVWDVVARSLDVALTAAVQLPATVMREVNSLLADPQKLAAQTEVAAAALGALGKLLLLEPDPDTRLRGPLVREKKVVWSRPLKVLDLKRIGRATGSTINDVLMTAVTGALRRYLVADGPVPLDLNVRGVVPVNLRNVEDAHQLGNQFGLVFLPLPLGIDDALDRLFEVRRRMQAIKRSPDAFVAFQILKAIGAAPKQIFDLVVNLFGRKATAVVTNVVGPREPMSIAGTRLRQSMFWVPCAGRLGLGISLLSYAGDVAIGIQTDVGLIPDPERLLAAFYAELDELIDLAAEAESLRVQ